MQALHAAFQLAHAIGSTSQPRLRVEAQRAIYDDVLVPPGETADPDVDAATILREKAFTVKQIVRSALELGKDLKLIWAYWRQPLLKLYFQIMRQEFLPNLLPAS